MLSQQALNPVIKTELCNTSPLLLVHTCWKAWVYKDIAGNFIMQLIIHLHVRIKVMQMENTLIKIKQTYNDREIHVIHHQSAI